MFTIQKKYSKRLNCSPPYKLQKCLPWVFPQWLVLSSFGYPVLNHSLSSFDILDAVFIHSFLIHKFSRISGHHFRFLSPHSLLLSRRKTESCTTQLTLPEIGKRLLYLCRHTNFFSLFLVEVCRATQIKQRPKSIFRVLLLCHPKKWSLCVYYITHCCCARYISSVVPFQ